MGLIELCFIAVGLSMDAFAVSICKGLACREQNLRNNLLAGLYFGGFQGLMPAIGWLLGVRFSEAITSIDHWIAFVLLSFIGGSMIRESRSGAEEEELDASFGFRAMLPLAVATSIDVLAVATSIDALAAGVSFAFLGMIGREILGAAALIGAVTFVLSAVGVRVGSVFGSRFKSRAELCGGVILIFIGLKILLEHLGILA